MSVLHEAWDVFRDPAHILAELGWEAATAILLTFPIQVLIRRHDRRKHHYEHKHSPHDKGRPTEVLNVAPRSQCDLCLAGADLRVRLHDFDGSTDLDLCSFHVVEMSGQYPDNIETLRRYYGPPPTGSPTELPCEACGHPTTGKCPVVGTPECERCSCG